MKTKLDPKLDLRPSEIHGTGCFTRQRLERGQFICSYEGERINHCEALHRKRKILSGRICYLNPNLAIDGNVGGNGTQYVNHSCRPNCYLVLTTDEIRIYAQKDIEPGEELTVDYFYELYLKGRKCRCQRTGCLDYLEAAVRFNSILEKV
jgi:SET domain-containing protein